MFYTSFIKTLPEKFSNPTLIATLASVGIHSLVAVSLPKLSASSNPETQKSQGTVGVVELTPAEQSRIPILANQTPQLPFQSSEVPAPYLLPSPLPSTPPYPFPLTPSPSSSSKYERKRFIAQSPTEEPVRTIRLKKPPSILKNRPSENSTNNQPRRRSRGFDSTVRTSRSLGDILDKLGDKNNESLNDFDQGTQSTDNSAEETKNQDNSTQESQSTDNSNNQDNSADETKNPDTVARNSPTENNSGENNDPQKIAQAQREQQQQRVLADIRQRRQNLKRDETGTRQEDALKKTVEWAAREGRNEEEQQNFVNWLDQVRKGEAPKREIVGTYPKDACVKKLEGTTTIGLVVDPNGSVSEEPVLIKSSGYPVFNEQALKDIKNEKLGNDTGKKQPYLIDVKFAYNEKTCPTTLSVPSESQESDEGKDTTT